MKTIIVATDFSDEANHAAAFAAQAAKDNGISIVLFHLYKVSIHAMNARLNPASLKELTEYSQSVLAKKAASLQETYQIAITTAWAVGDFYEEIEKTILEHNASLVVMGMPKKSLEQDLLGNTTTAAIHTLKFPILAIPSGATYKGFKNILFACDIVRGVHKKVLEKVKDVAISFGATVEIFHVNDKADQLAQQEPVNHNKHKFGEGLDGVRYYYRNVQSNTVIKAIQDEINYIDADLLIMVPYKYGFWGSLIHVCLQTKLDT